MDLENRLVVAKGEEEGAGYKINIWKLVAFLYTNNEILEKEYRNTIPFNIAS